MSNLIELNEHRLSLLVEWKKLNTEFWQASEKGEKVAPIAQKMTNVAELFTMSVSNEIEQRKV